MWDQLTIGYLAALIDGEGHIYSGHRVYVNVTSCDRDIVDRAHSLSGIGNVNGPYKQKNINHNEFWTWTVTKHKDIARLVCAITPLMSQRKTTTQITPMIDRISKAIPRDTECIICEQIFKPKRVMSGSKTPKYCSGACKTKAHTQRRRNQRCPAPVKDHAVPGN